MPTNISNAESAWLLASTRIKQWQAIFMATWKAPAIETDMQMTARKVMSLPDPVKQQLQTMEPAGYDQVQKMLKGR